MGNRIVELSHSDAYIARHWSTFISPHAWTDSSLATNRNDNCQFDLFTAKYIKLVCYWKQQTACVFAKMNMSLSNDTTTVESIVGNSTEAIATSLTSTSSGIDWYSYVIRSLQWIIFVVGSVGNITVLVVLLWRRSRSQVGTQLFVGSLAVADLGLMCSTVWVAAYEKSQPGWPFGVITCKLKYMWQFLTLNTSIWTLAALSIDRYSPIIFAKIPLLEIYDI